MAQSKLSVRETLRLLHPNAADRIKSTRWWTFATILDTALYNGYVRSEKFGMSLEGADIPGIDGTQVDLARVLRELAHECEAMALVEATK